MDRDTTANEPAEEEPMSDLAAMQVAPRGRLERVLSFVPRALSSRAHIMFLGALGTYLVLLPLLGVDVSAKAELIGGNYTNVTSDLGACIAAGLTVHLVRRDRRHSAELAEAIGALRAHQEQLHRRLERTIAAREDGGGATDRRTL